MIDEPKTCPFCGEKPHLIEVPTEPHNIRESKITDRRLKVLCKGRCGVRPEVEIMGNDISKAIAIWNRRGA